MGIAPENTLVSFRRALEEGAQIVEFDVRQSLDREIVILHDATLERTTNGSGLVGGYSLKELKMLDAGYRFTPDGGVTYPYRGQNVRIPTLEEFFSSFPRTRAIVEIKHLSSSIVTRTLEIVLKFHGEEQVLLATEDDKVMKEIRNQLKRQSLTIATGFSYGEVADFVAWVQIGMAAPYVPPGQAFQIPPEYENITLVSRETIEAAHSLGIEMFVWTVNQPEEMQRLLGLGVDAIITDYPSRLRVLIHQPM